MDFTKAQTNGNDFVIMEYSKSVIADVRLISDRHFGIGCDQVIFWEKNPDLSYKIRFYNADGSIALMCGNGMCAFMKFLYEKKEESDGRFLVGDDHYNAFINGKESVVNFKFPKIIKTNIEINNQYSATLIDVGNFHLIVNVGKNLKIITTDFAGQLQNKYQNTNIHFFNSIDQTIRMRSFENGVGWTKSCGSGSVSVAYLLGRGKYEVISDGGTSKVNITDEKITFISCSQMVFSGKFYANK